MLTNPVFKTYDPEAQAIVIGDLMAAFKSLSEGEEEEEGTTSEVAGVTVKMVEARD
jgi:hypothetical protein